LARAFVESASAAVAVQPLMARRCFWSFAACLFVARQAFAARCHVGSRSDCGNHGICEADPFFDNKPFFNKCKCDFCWQGDCHTNLCLFMGIPFALFFGCCVLLCCCACVHDCLVAAALGVGAVGVANAIGNSRYYRGHRRVAIQQPELMPQSGMMPRPGVAPLITPQPYQVASSQPCQAAALQPSAPPSSMPQRLFAVTCPAGALPGQQLLTATPDGQQVHVVVPPGVGPGDVFNVQY